MNNKHLKKKSDMEKVKESNYNFHHHNLSQDTNSHSYEIQA